MTGVLEPRAIGADLERIDGQAKVRGTAPYAFDYPADDPGYLFPLQATIARGRITSIDTSAAQAQAGVLAVLTHDNAPTLYTRELAILQSGEVAFRGQFIGAVIAETSEIARHAASLVRVEYAQQQHDVSLRADREDLYKPDKINPAYQPDTFQGDVEGALAAAPVAVDRTYTTPMEHNNPMEPHTTVAVWDAEARHLTLYDSTQGVHPVRKAVAPVLGLDTEQIRVVAPHVGGGFGSKGTAHPHIVLAAVAAQRLPGRPVKFALTRQQMFSLVGYRTPTIQHVRLGADDDGTLSAISMDVVEQTSRIKEFAEQTGMPARMMYAAPNRRTTHRLAALDVAVPSWMRAPGECPGMFGPEVAMDELAGATGVDPVQLRIRNEPETDPETGNPFSSRNLVTCLQAGAARFGWSDRKPAPGTWLEDGWRVGTGVASSVYPVYRQPGSTARIRYSMGGRYRVAIGFADIGTGSWTALTQIAADALGVEPDRVELQIGDTDLPNATVAGGSSGTTSWGSAIVETARAFRDKFGADPAAGDEIEATTPDNPEAKNFAMYAFGAQFAEVRVHADTGEIRVPRLLGVFGIGQVINSRLARSQLIGGMTMGLSMALHEHSVTDERFGHVVNHDFADYHIAANADVKDIDATWVDEHDPHANPMGSKGIGEIGITGTAAAIANAAHHATGVRLRDLPLTPDRFVA